MVHFLMLLFMLIIYYQIRIQILQNLKVMFKNPVAAVAPGQSVVFYDGMDCLGGAVIDKHIKE